MKIIKLIFVVVSLPLGVASYQAQAANYVYNSQNQMVGIDNHQIQYSPSGGLARADSLKFISQVQVQGSIASTRFGGVILFSDGTYDTTFMDGHNLSKTSKDRTYSAPYGTHKAIDLDIHNNKQVFGGGYSLFGATYMGARWYFQKLRHFGAQDTYDVGNRFNIDQDNPVMNYDPSGHITKSTTQILTFLGLTIAAFASYGVSTLFESAAEVGLASIVGEAGDGVESVVNKESIVSTIQETEAKKIIKTPAPAPTPTPTAYPATARWGGYTTSTIMPSALTAYQKVKSGANTGNLILSVLIPAIAGGIGNLGMFTNVQSTAKFFGALDNALEGAAFPVMNKKDMKIDQKTFHEMVAGLISGAFSGYIGGNYNLLGNADVGSWGKNYGRSLGWFGARGLTMEAGRQGVYGLIMMYSNPNYVANLKVVGMQILVNGPIQSVEGLVMKGFKTKAESNTGSFGSIFRNSVGFNLGGNVMQVGSPLVDSLIT